MEWTRGPILGRGSSATVSTATSTTGDLFAVKSADLSKSESLQNEQHFLSILKSPYILTNKGYEITRQNNNMVYNIFIDYMSGGSIIDFIKNRGLVLNDSEIGYYTRQIVQGLDFIHSNGIVHCDIKGSNILIDGNCVKISDFGCAKWVDQVTTVRGTPLFMAPEVAGGEEQGFPADIWALGCTMIEMATGCSPWKNVDDPVTVLYKIAFSGEIPRIPDEFSDQAKDFVGKCLVRDPRKRWTAKELLKHPYIRQFDENLNQIVCEKTRTGSPTSILDQDVWNSMEECSSMVGSEYGRCDGLLKSLRQRIKQLAGDTEMPKWRCEMGGNDWFNVRINGDGDGRGDSGAVAVGEDTVVDFVGP